MTKKKKKTISETDILKENMTKLETAVYTYIRFKLNMAIHCLNSEKLSRSFDLLIGNERVTSYYYVHECLQNKKKHQTLQLDIFERNQFFKEYGKKGYSKEGFAKTYLLALFYLQTQNKNLQKCLYFSILFFFC